MDLGQKTLKTAFAIATLASLVACGKTNENHRASTRGTNAIANVQHITSSLSTCGNGQNAVGYVSDASGNGVLTEEVQALVSATMNPNEFGEVVGGTAATGIDFRLRVRRSGAGFTSDTQMQLMIYDQYAVNRVGANGQAVTAYPITMYTATGGTYNGVSGYVDFTDKYGVIRVHIQSNSGTSAQGYIEFQNNASTTGTNQSGILGSFVIPPCTLQ